MVFAERVRGHSLPLGELLEDTQYGLSLAPEMRGTFPILRMTNLVDGEVIENDIRYVKLSENEFKKYRLEHGDVLFNRTNSIDLVGRTGHYALDGDHVFASYLVRLRVKREILLPEYLTAFLNAPPGRSQILQFATKGVSQANVNASNLKKVRIPLPPISRQQSAVREIFEMRSGLRELHRRLDAATDVKRIALAALSRGGP
jgi:restriction endonuclease S subunit